MYHKVWLAALHSDPIIYIFIWPKEFWGNVAPFMNEEKQIHDPLIGLRLSF